MRVAVETRALSKRADLPLSQGVGEYQMSGDVVKILAVLDSGGNPLAPIQTDDALSIISSGDPFGNVQGYYSLVPGVIGLLPTPSGDGSVTIYYQARPAVLDSDDEFELTGEYENLIEKLMLAYRLDDDGQPELAQEHQSYYLTDMGRLRRLRSDEQPSRVQVAQ